MSDPHQKDGCWPRPRRPGVAHARVSVLVVNRCVLADRSRMAAQGESFAPVGYGHHETHFRAVLDAVKASSLRSARVCTMDAAFGP